MYKEKIKNRCEENNNITYITSKHIEKGNSKTIWSLTSHDMKKIGNSKLRTNSYRLRSETWIWEYKKNGGMGGKVMLGLWKCEYRN